MSIEAMKMALEALEDVQEAYGNHSKWFKDRVDALRQAIEQAEEREPLEYWNAVEGWVKIDEVREHLDSVGCGTIYKSAGEGRSPLYTAPPKKEWVGLTDEEIVSVANTVDGFGVIKQRDMNFARAIEAAHGIKEKNKW